MFGDIFKGVASLLQGEAAYDASKYNARTLKQDARLVEEEAKINEARQRRLAYKQISSMRANYGASGVTIEGSPLDVIEESAAMAEHDALLIRHAGAVRATSLRNSAALTLFEGRTARVSGYLGAAGSFSSLIPAGT
jgi:hypothetical protein